MNCEGTVANNRAGNCRQPGVAAAQAVAGVGTGSAVVLPGCCAVDSVGGQGVTGSTSVKVKQSWNAAIEGGAVVLGRH